MTEFRTRICRVTDKRTGNQLVVHDFRKDEAGEMGRKLVRQARNMVAAHVDGISGFAIVTYDLDFVPTTCWVKDDVIPFGDSVWIAMLGEAFRSRVLDDQISEELGETTT